MEIDPALDVWVWATALLFLGMMGARAWVVETGQFRVGRTPAKVRVLTGSTVAVLVVLAGLLTVQGGMQLADMLLGGNVPATTGAADPAPGDPEPGEVGADPAIGDPAVGVPPGDGN